MKQKNLILVAVAVGCGLVAAVLTSQMSAGNAPTVEYQEVPVAAKELPMGTWLRKDEINTYIVFKKFPKDNLPAAFAAAKEDLADKRTARLIRKDEPFNPADLTTNVSIQPPEGTNMMALPFTAATAAAGFCVPGSRVDVSAAVTMNSMGGRGVIFPMLTNMLVLAVDTQSSTPAAGTNAVANLSMISLAVTNEQAQIIHAANRRGADLRLVLRHPEKPPEWKYIPTEKEVWGIMADDPKRAFSHDGHEITEQPKDDKLKLPVPKEDLPAGTQLTQEVLETKFTTIDFTPPAPANILADLKELKDQYLTSGLAANQFVPKNFLAAKPNGKSAPDLASAPTSKEGLETAKADAPAPTKAAPVDTPVYHDVTIQTTSGTTTYRYQVLANSEFKYVGVVPTGGTAKPAEKKPDGGAGALGDDDDAPAKKPAPKKKPAKAETEDEDDAPAKKPAAKK